MRTIRLEVSSLFEFEGAPPAQSPDLVTITSLVVGQFGFEIGLLGQRGLDYADSEPKYTLRSLPEEKFSGLQLMCLMHAGFKRFAPGEDTGLDLDEPFLTALELFAAKPRDAG